MLHIVSLQESQLHSTADAVVSTQGGTLSGEPLTVDVGLDGVTVEVNLHVHELVAHHVHVALQDDRLAVLHALGGRLANQDVAGFIYFGLQLVAFTPLAEILNHLFLTLGRAGNLVNSGKLFENTLRL